MTLKKLLRRLLNHFLRGVLVLLPAALTISIFVKGIQWLDGLLDASLPPGVGFLILVVGTTLVGLIASNFFVQPILSFLDDLLEKAPGIKIIYSSIKDMLQAFVGEKRKFTEAVLVQLGPEGVYKPGFITQKDLSSLGLQDLVAVYFPHSYNFSGNLFLVKKELIKPIQGSNSADLMKFIVSGGVTDIE